MVIRKKKIVITKNKLWICPKFERQYRENWRDLSTVVGRKQITPFLLAISMSEKIKEDESGKGKLEKPKRTHNGKILGLSNKNNDYEDNFASEARNWFGKA